jgi:hypothetical protein
MATSITRHPPSIENERIAGARACLAALAKLVQDAQGGAWEDDYRAYLKHRAKAAETLVEQFGSLSARQEGAFLALAEYLHSDITTGKPNLEKWVPAVGQTAAELEQRIQEAQQQIDSWEA